MPLDVCDYFIRRWSKWSDISGFEGGREFQVGSGVIVVVWGGPFHNGGWEGRAFGDLLFFCKQPHTPHHGHVDGLSPKGNLLPAWFRLPTKKKKKKEEQRSHPIGKVFPVLSVVLCSSSLSPLIVIVSPSSNLCLTLVCIHRNLALFPRNRDCTHG